MQDPSTKRESMAGMAGDMLEAYLLEAHRVASLRPAARDERPELEIKVPPPAAAKRGHARALLGFISHPFSRFGMPCFGLTAQLDACSRARATLIRPTRPPLPRSSGSRGRGGRFCVRTTAPPPALLREPREGGRFCVPMVGCAGAWPWSVEVGAPSSDAWRRAGAPQMRHRAGVLCGSDDCKSQFHNYT